jgi:hypothetical protein
MPTDHDFEQFWASHKLASAIAKATLTFFSQVSPDLKMPMALGGELETLRAAVWHAYQHRFDDDPDDRPATRPSHLTLVN